MKIRCIESDCKDFIDGDEYEAISTGMGEFEISENGWNWYAYRAGLGLLALYSFDRTKFEVINEVDMPEK